MIALGYTMVYGIAKLLNFAHGDIIMVGGYIIYVFLATKNPILAIVMAVIGCMILGICIEKVAYNYEDLQKVMAEYTPGATLEDLRKLAEAYTYEDAVARRA